MLMETQLQTIETATQPPVVAIESVPPVFYRAMHPAETVQYAKPLTIHWWSASIAESITSVYRFVVRSWTALNASEQQS